MSYYKAGKIMKDMLPILLFLAFFSIFSGYFLDSGKSMRVFASLLIVVPPFINMGGDIASIVGARITSALHLGRIRSIRDGNIVYYNILSAIIISIVSFFILGLFAEFLLIILFNDGIGFVNFALITLLAGVSTTTILSFFVVIIAFLSYRYGIDPDDTSIPIITTLGDIVGVINLIMFTKLIIGG